MNATILSSKSKRLSSMLGAALTAGLILLPAGDAAAQPFTLSAINVGQQRVYFGTTVQPPNTCSYFGRYFTFVTTPASEDAKNMYAFLLASKLSGKQVALWYNPSSRPGMDETNGCNLDTMATLYEIGWYD